MTFDYDKHDHRSEYGHRGRKEYAWGPMYGHFMKKFMGGCCGPSGYRNYQQTTPEGDGTCWRNEIVRHICRGIC